MQNYLSSLNDSQREAVVYCDGPQLVIAGAGSGKTRVLTMKIAYLIEQGYRPDQIIALTFTKKAANEMRQRIMQLVEPSLARRLWMGTFHSLFSRILRSESQYLGFKSDFTIYDQSDSRSLVKSIIKEMGLDDKKYKPNGIQCQISNAKNNLVTPDMYRGNRELMEYDYRAGRSQFSEIYLRYWNRCYQAGAMDFDDLLLYTNILFRDHPDVLAKYQEHFQYILVDEYQDTNRAQHLIVEQLARTHRRLCVVGDDAQSIYSFRGANIHNILNLRQSVPGTQLFKLEQNYRSTQNIVNAANSLIRKNSAQIPKHIFSEKDKGSLLQVSGTFSDLEEAAVVASRIESLHNKQQYSYNDIAILYRTNAQSRTLEEALRKHGIDYRIYGGLSFYQRREIKDILAYLRLIINPADEEAFKRIINYPARGIGDTTVKKLAEVVSQQQVTFFDICCNPSQYPIKINRGTHDKLLQFADLITRFRTLDSQLDAYHLTERVINESGIKTDLNSDTTIEGQSRRENVEELLSALQTFVASATEEGRDCRLLDFLSEVSLSGDVEPEENTTEDETERVLLMTIHAAKGLEFKNVFIVGLEENLLPSDMSINEPGGVEEERRLMYVALTRAQENCFLSYATSRFRNGRSDICRPSRFLKEIDGCYLQSTDSSSPLSSATGYGNTGGGHFAQSFSSRGYNVPATSSHPTVRKPQSSVLDFTGPVRKMAGSKQHTPTDALPYQGHILTVDTRIAHERFGKGTISAISNEGDNARITVKFDNVGEKTLLLKFAKISVIE